MSLVKNQDIRKPIEEYLKENKYTFQVQIRSQPGADHIKLMIFTITDALITTNPVIQLFFRDSYTHRTVKNGNVDIWIVAQKTAMYDYQSNKEIKTVQAALEYVSTRCRPIAQRKPAVVDEQILNAEEELETMKKEAAAAQEMDVFVGGVLSSLPGFFLRDIRSLQDEYVRRDDRAYTAALARRKEELLYLAVRTYSPLIRELNRTGRE
jgi:hypothetical protein